MMIIIVVVITFTSPLIVDDIKGRKESLTALQPKGRFTWYDFVVYSKPTTGLGHD